MSDLIERQMALDAIDKAFERSNPLNGYIRAFVVNAISEVRKLPSAEPTKAQWEYYPALYAYGVPHYKCSLCGHQVQYRTPFCPGCGSEMRGEDV